MSSAKPASGKPRKPSKEQAPRIVVEQTLRTTTNIEEIVRKIKSEVEKGAAKMYTPYTLAQALEVRVSDAKRALKEAVKLGILKVYSPGRRSPIYIPGKQQS